MKSLDEDEVNVEAGDQPNSAAAAVTAHGDSATENDDDDNDFWTENIVNPADMDPRLQEMVLCSALCNMATIHHDSESNTWQANGDATEIALQVFAHKLAHGKTNLTRAHKKSNDLRRFNSHTSSVPHRFSEGHFELVIEHPFDSTIKRMSTAWKAGNADGPSDECFVFLKGAIERVLDRCSYVSMADEQVALTDELKDDILARVDVVSV